MNNTDAPTGEQINRAIHIWMGECWHETHKLTFDERLPVYGFFGFKRFDLPAFAKICDKCSADIEPMIWNNKLIVANNLRWKYTASLDAVRVAELKAMEVFGYFAFAGALYMEIVDEDTDDTDDMERVVAAAAIATADQRARSIYSLIISAQQEKE